MEFWNGLGDLGLQKIVWWSSKTSEPWRKTWVKRICFETADAPYSLLNGQKVMVGIMRWCNWRREIQPRSRCRFLVVYPNGFLQGLIIHYLVDDRRSSKPSTVSREDETMRMYVMSFMVHWCNGISRSLNDLPLDILKKKVNIYVLYIYRKCIAWRQTVVLFVERR